MVHLEEVINVPVTPQQAFDYVADFTTTEEWDPGVDRARQVDGHGPGLGARYEIVSNFGGRELVLHYVTEGFDRPHRLVFRGGDRRFESVDTIDFAEAHPGTEIVYTADFRMKGVLAILEPWLRRRFRAVATAGATGLAQALARGG